MRGDEEGLENEVVDVAEGRVEFVEGLIGTERVKNQWNIAY